MTRHIRDESALFSLALVLLAAVGACSDRGSRFDFTGNDIEAAQLCHDRGFSHMHLNSYSSLQCLHRPQADALDVEATLVEARDGGLIR